jgi:hypothetical protein
LSEIPNHVLQVLWDATRNPPTDKCEAMIMTLGGKIGDVPADETAFAHRDAVH